MPRKRRTRQHVIAEFSANYVERYILLCGFSTERVEHDYGVDLILFTYNDDGEIENGQVFIQLKATDHINILGDNQTIAFSVQRADLELWLNEPMPCILVVYDALTDIAYWEYIQAYFENLPNFDIEQIGNSVTVHVQKHNTINEDAIRLFAGFRDAVLNQLEGVIRHSAY